MKKFFLLALLIPLFFTGCATVPSQTELLNADYGQPLTCDYKGVIKSIFMNYLKDGMSAEYQFGKPDKFFYRDAPLMGGKTFIGYGVYVRVNAKNSYGGYTGFQSWMFIFRDNLLIKKLAPEDLVMLKTKNYTEEEINKK